MGKANLKAIETEYAGYRFRSRQEARWAVWFDNMGIKWRYEAEGFDLGDGMWYLPDFWLPEIPNFAKDTFGWWIEVKGKFPTDEEMEKAARLAQQGDNGVAIIWSNFDSDSAKNEIAFFKDENGVFHSDQGGIMCGLLCGWIVPHGTPPVETAVACFKIRNVMDVADKAARRARFGT